MKVVCILAMVHNGTTLLDLVLGGHPRFVGLGELSAFDDRFGRDRVLVDSSKTVETFGEGEVRAPMQSISITAHLPG